MALEEPQKDPQSVAAQRKTAGVIRMMFNFSKLKLACCGIWSG
jgi:hypothetical protein